MQQVQEVVRMRDAVADRRQAPWIVVPGQEETVADRRQAPWIVVRGIAAGHGRPRPSPGTPVRSVALIAVARRERPVAEETIAFHLSEAAGLIVAAPAT